MKCPRLFLLGAVTLGALVACDDGNRRYFDNSTTELSIQLSGVPAPLNDMQELIEQTDETPQEIDGQWEGVFNLYLNDVAAPYRLDISIQTSDADIVIESIKEGVNSDVFENVRFQHPILNFDFTGSFYDIDGAPLRYQAELVVLDGEMRGLIRRVIAERGGYPFFVEYDLEFRRARE